MRETILVVDDEKEIADLIEVYLQSEGMDVRKFYNGRQALSYIQNTTPDLAILDVMLPDADGFSLCRAIRDGGRTYPIIILSAKGEEWDKITGLSMGADDYIAKPFQPMELVARVKAQLRRYKTYSLGSNEPEDDGILQYGSLRMNTRSYKCWAMGTPLELTPTEFSILRILLERRGDVVSAEELFHEIWQEEYYSKNNNTITAHIRHLREKIHDACGENCIKTVWGVGYQLA